MRKKRILIRAFNYSLFYHFSLALRIFLKILVDWSTRCFKKYNQESLILLRYEYGGVYILFRWRILEH